MSESQIEQAILQLLNLNKVFAFKVKDNTRSIDGKHRKPMPYQVNGVSDIIAMHDGKVFFIEVKTDVGQQSLAQKNFQKQVELSSNEYLLWRSLADAKKWLEHRIFRKGTALSEPSLAHFASLVLLPQSGKP
jgi:hypothetical protein